MMGYTKEEVMLLKAECLQYPEKKLWFRTKDMVEVRNIFNHIKSLEYKDKPNYKLIRDNLKSILASKMKVPSIILVPTKTTMP